jgi:hypothetical protein
MGNEGENQDLGRIAEELAAYRKEVKEVIKPGIQNSSAVAKEKGRNAFMYKLHKYSAYGEEFFDKCPRICWYAFWPYTIAFIAAVIL